jgi:hypothetical protein
MSAVPPTPYCTSPEDKDAIKRTLCDAMTAVADRKEFDLGTFAYALIRAHAVVNERVVGPGCLGAEDADCIKRALGRMTLQAASGVDERFSALADVAAMLVASYSIVDAFTRLDSTEDSVAWIQTAAARAPGAGNHQEAAAAVDREGLLFANRVADAAWQRAEALRGLALADADAAAPLRSCFPSGDAATAGAQAGRPAVAPLSQ